MKQDTFLFILTLALAFGTGNLTYFLKSKKIATIEDIDFINSISIDMQNERRPVIRMDLNIEYPSMKHLQLLDDDIAFVQGSIPYSVYSIDCSPFIRNRLSFGKSEKFKLWMDHECDQSVELPRSFFLQPPFLLETGESYAYLQFTQLRNEFDKIYWLNNFSRYMHIDELRGIRYPLPPNIDFLRRLPKTTLKQILIGYTRILSPTYYFIKTANMQYFVVERQLAEREYGKAGFILSTERKQCFFNAGNICWRKKPHGLVSFLSQTSIILFLGTFFIFIMTTRMLYLRIKRQSQEEERKKHALRVLTHELRTPVASLLLMIENLTKKAETLPAELNEDLVRIESDIYRLKHLAEKSQGYLQTDSTDLMNFQLMELPSLKEYCEDLISEYQDTDIVLQIETDCSFYSDPYWLKLCLTNLIENARRYGKPPITIKVWQNEDNIFISVIDKGSIQAKGLKQLLKKRQTNSKGLGIGLTIVQKTLKAMDAELLFKNDPTEFTIQLTKRGKQK